MLGSGRREAAESVKEETTAGVRQAYGRRTAVRIYFQPEEKKLSTHKMLTRTQGGADRKKSTLSLQ